ncbi:VOC family protein [Streptomyces sp. ISL-100]|uniref:VOC family protein n=1 Tax=Streptomyces sp. ISL-100 TaxID=2819173 RepID=UPI0027E41DF2|nr:VOC family protein [Streptomyces sp. ISL-100]
MARDLGGAERFYGAVLGWTFRRGGFGRAFCVAEVDGVTVAGIGAMAAELAVPAAWTVYFSVADADVAAARIRERGGTVGVGPVSFPPRGRAALVADPEGASFGIWEGRALSGWRVGEGGAPAWVELHTRNAFDAALFYGGVLEWGNGGEGGCEVWYEEDQVVLRQGGEPVARLNSGPVEEAARRPQLRPRWLVHFKVPDLESAKAAALEHGGSIASGAEWGGHGQQVTLRDPDGGLFTLDQVVPDRA